MNAFSLCPEVTCYTNPLCDTKNKGRIIAAFLVDKDYSSLVDKTTKANYLSSLFYLYAQGYAILINNVAGEKPRPETAELAGTGMRINKPGGKTHTINIMDMAIMAGDNGEFYNSILETSQNYDFYYYTPGKIWDVSGQTITMIGDPVIPNDLTQFIGGEVTVKWVQDGNPLASDFDTETLLKGLKYIIDGDFYLEATEGSETAYTPFTATFNQSLPSGPQPALIWSIQGEDDVIEALAAEIDAESGVLTVGSTETGTFTITVVVTGEGNCIVGYQSVQITVAAA